MTATALHERMNTLARRAAGLSWFSSLGAPLTEAEVEDALSQTTGVGLPALPVAAVGSWDQARMAARTPLDPENWWAAEERLRRVLLDAAVLQHGREPLMAALTEATQLGAAPVPGAAAIAAARMGVLSREMIGAAAGAATQAVYLAALAEAAGHDAGYPFTAKLRLFAGGRWPLGVVDGKILVF